jgi:N-acetyl-alpha-D-glucosaminyl L-malate synthase BshA
MNKILNPKSSILNLKIGIVCYPSVGGSGIVATNLGLELSKLGHEVHFISYEPPFRLMGKHKNIFFHKVHINEYSLFKYPDYTLPLAVEIEKVQKKFELDILHVHYAFPHAAAALLARRIMRSNNIPLPKIVTTLHGTDITLLAKDPNLFEAIKYSIERSHGVTTVSQSLKEETIKVLKTDKPIEVIYNFYSPPTPTKSRAAMRKGLKIKDTDILGIHLSNLRPVKRIPDLLKIVAQIKNEPKFKLLILSGADFSPYKPLVKKLGIQNKIIVKEKVKDIENYLNAADIGIFTSETESFGMGALEAMSYGSPVLATNSGGTPEVIEHNKTGLLCKVGDTKSFVKNLKLLIANSDLRKQMGEAAKQAACEKFCSKKIVPEYVEYYKKILKS